MTTDLSIAVDVMGGDGGVGAMLHGCAKALEDGITSKLILFGNEPEMRRIVAAEKIVFPHGRIEFRHAEDVVTMDTKPSQAMRRGRKTSMWAAISAVKEGEANAIVSCGNTGALMAMSVLQLRMIEGVDRPAITALWPNMRDRQTVVLDVGANVEATAEQLVQFAIMGEAYFRALTGKEKPTVGLLNVGAEELKGHELIRTAATTLRDADPEMSFEGFVEGNDLSKGTVDVVVTDGFTGNIALKAAEGTARMIGSWVRGAVTSGIFAKMGALMMYGGLKQLRDRSNPSNVNGAPLLGLNGLVIKSHGGSDADGVASALKVADNLARHPFQDEIKATIAKVSARAEKLPPAGETDESGKPREAVG